MKVLIKAPLLSATGYGTHSRQVFKYLLDKGLDVSVNIVPWGICTYIVDGDAEDGLIGEIMKRSGPLNEGEKPDVSIQVRLPNEWEPDLAKVNIGVTAGVETDVCSQQWVQCCENMDLVIVPSQHSRETFLKSGLSPEKIVVVSESLSEASPCESLSLSLSTKFNFMLFGQITAAHPELDRKNTFYAIKWFAETFKNDPNVGLIIKTNSGRYTQIDKNLTTKLLSALINEVRGENPYPKFYLCHGYMTSEEVSSFYRQDNVHALLAPTRGEGFGLTILEAAAAGLPVIATNWSGHMDFMKLTRFLELKYKLVDIPTERVDENIFVSGAKWAQVDEENFKQRISKFRKSHSIPTTWAKEGATKIKEKFSFQEICKQYDSVLGEFFE